MPDSSMVLNKFFTSLKHLPNLDPITADSAKFPS
jgi:hypothetical protein